MFCFLHNFENSVIKTQYAALSFKIELYILFIWYGLSIELKQKYYETSLKFIFP